MALTVCVEMPGKLSKQVYQHKGSKSPAAFMLDAMKYYIAHLEGNNTSTSEEVNERNSKSVRTDNAHPA